MSSPLPGFDTATQTAAELSPSLLRRVLAVFEFENCDELFWRFDGGVMSMFVTCSDFFGWACADVEPVETEEDVAALEQARSDLADATNDRYPIWIGELYASRRRNVQPADFMFGDGEYAMEPAVQSLFRGVHAGSEAL